MEPSGVGCCCARARRPGGPRVLNTYLTICRLPGRTPSRHERAERVAPHALRVVGAQEATPFEGGETLTERAELHASLGLAALTEQAYVPQPPDPGVQAGERILLSGAELTIDVRGHSGPQKANREQRRVCEDEAAEDDHARLHQVPGGIVGGG